MLRAERPHFLQKLRGMHDHPAGALQQRLHNHRRNFSPALRQQCFQLLRALDLACLTLQPHRAAVTIRRMHAMHRITHPGKRLRKRRIIAHRHRPGGIAVITMLQRRNFSFFSALLIAEMLHRHLQRHFHRGRAIIGEKQMRQLRRDPLPQPPHQLFRGFMCEARENDMLQFSRLLRDRRRNSRIRVPVQIHPPGRNRIQNLSPVSCVQVNAFRPLDLQWRKVQPGMSKGMPDAQRRIHRASVL